MALLLAFAFAAPLLTRGTERCAACLFGAATILLLVAPILTSEYDYRFTIPAFGPLAVTATIGVNATAMRLRQSPIAARWKGWRLAR
jgi:hypothetical protein